MTVSEVSEPAPPPPLPFRMPCADDDLAGCTTGCADKQPEDCVTLGAIYLSGAVAGVDVTRAVVLLRAACLEGSARGCLKLGDALHAGLTRGDDAEEIDCYRRACDGGANLGCLAAGHAYLSGHGVGADPVFAAALFRKVCEKGNAHACFELGRLFKAGEGVPRSADSATDMFTKACELGLDQGCLAVSRKGELSSPRE